MNCNGCWEYVFSYKVGKWGFSVFIKRNILLKYIANINAHIVLKSHFLACICSSKSIAHGCMTNAIL